jgi:hypothetical protein
VSELPVELSDLQCADGPTTDRRLTRNGLLWLVVCVRVGGSVACLYVCMGWGGLVWTFAASIPRLTVRMNMDTTKFKDVDDDDNTRVEKEQRGHRSALSLSLFVHNTRLRTTADLCTNTLSLSPLSSRQLGDRGTDSAPTNCWFTVSPQSTTFDCSTS